MRKQLWTRLSAAALAVLLTAALPAGAWAAAQEDTVPPAEEAPLTEILPAEPQSPQETPAGPVTPPAEGPAPVQQEVPLTEILPAEPQSPQETPAGPVTPPAEGSDPVQQEVPLTEILSAEPLAQAMAKSIQYIDANGQEQTTSGVPNEVTENDIAWGTADNETWYVANADIAISQRVTVTGDVHLILADGCDLTIDGGIQVTYPSSLTIYGQSAGSGELTATAKPHPQYPYEAGEAGIGSSADLRESKFSFCGSVTINGGTVTATGADMSAGIGGGPASGGNIVINGGTVSATGGANGAGIGGGMQCNGGYVTINGGEVTARGGNQAAGIGSGTYEGRFSIQINGGTVNATGGPQGAGIGNGMACSNVASVTITGGTVNATGGYQAAGIGGGAQTPGGRITISGGEVTATGADGASGIGHGGLGATGGEITISGGTVTATGGSANPGISCQDSPTSDPIGQDGWILISGGTVYASPHAGEEDGPAIRGSFKTGTAGNAFVVATGTGITDDANQADWSGVIFNGGADGQVYGSPTLETDAKIPTGKGLTIPEGRSLTVSYGTKLELTNSTLTVESGATLTNNGTISGDSNSEVESHGSLGGSGTVEGGITVPDPKDPMVSISPSSAAYGSEVTLTAQISQAPAANVHADPGKVDFYLGTKDAGKQLGTAGVIDNTASLTITLSKEQGFNIGENTITADFGGSMVLQPKIGSAQLTVTGNLQDAVVTVDSPHVYTGSPITPEVSVTWNNTQLIEDTDYTLAYTDNTNAGTATVTVNGKGYYTGTVSENFTIGKATPTPTTPTDLTATYGDTLANVKLPAGWAWDNPDTSVGDVGEKEFSATYTKDSSGNYNEVKQDLTVKVNPAPYKIALTGQADSPTQITLDEAVVEPGNTGTTVTYGYNTTNSVPGSWQTERVFSGLTADTTYYFFAKAEAKGNYAETISQGVAITTPKKSVSGIEISAQPANLSYTSGQTLDLSGLLVKVDYNDNTSETLTGESGKLTAAPAQGTVLTVAEHHGKTITISYGGKTAETNALTVGRAAQALLSITGAPGKIYTGSSFTLQTSGGSGDGAVTWSVVSGPVTVDANGTVTVTDTGEFQIKAVKAETVEYDQAEAVITLTAVKRPSGGGGSSSSGSSGDYTVSVDADKHGTVTVSPKRADKGDTVTITVRPDKGYELDELTVTDKSGDTVKLKDKGNGKFTFTMPGSKVTVEASFKQIDAEPEVPTFADVPADAYYADAVAWAVKEGITSGTGANTFSPALSCTRAQMVTFLWRANGSPVVNDAMSFTDVPADAYYAEAVRWAVSEGITSGTTATTFSPDATVTRAQAVTFIYRNVQAQGGGFTGSWMFPCPFTDVPADAYYFESVQWCAMKNITSGTSADTFSPNAPCTRAQIVTFLYREAQ